jgi:hypothetical protein
LSGLDKNRWIACYGLVAPHDHIDIKRVELDSATNTAGGLGSNEARAGTQEWIDYDVAPMGEVEKRVLSMAVGLTVG